MLNCPFPPDHSIEIALVDVAFNGIGWFSYPHVINVAPASIVGSPTIVNSTVSEISPKQGAKLSAVNVNIMVPTSLQQACKLGL